MNWHEWIDANELKWISVDLTLKKWSEPVTVFCDFYGKSNSRYSPVRILSTSSSKSGPNPAVFDDFYVINYLMTTWSTDEMDISLHSRARAHFVDLIFKNRESFQPWIHAVPIADTSQLLDDDDDDDDDDVIDIYWHVDWDDDVVAMMVRQLVIDNRP